MWPFVEFLDDKFSSRTIPAGTLAMKPIVVYRDVHSTFIVNKFYPLNRVVWQSKRKGTIQIQQDNAQTHADPKYPIIAKKEQQSGLEI